MPVDEGDALHDAGVVAAQSGLGPLVEIGSYCGKSAIYLGAAARAGDTVLFSVDHHRGSEENQSGWDHHDTEVVDPATGRMDTLPFFRRTLVDAQLEDAVVALVGDSPTIARWWAQPIALLFIDGGHGAEPAWADYRGWTPAHRRRRLARHPRRLPQSRRRRPPALRALPPSHRPRRLRRSHRPRQPASPTPLVTPRRHTRSDRTRTDRADALALPSAIALAMPSALTIAELRVARARVGLPCRLAARTPSANVRDDAALHARPRARSTPRSVAAATRRPDSSPALPALERNRS